MKAVLFDVGDTLVTEESIGNQPTWMAILEKTPHVDEVLEYLWERYPLGIVSDTVHTNSKLMRIALRSVGIDHFFKSIVTSLDVGVEKPSEKIFRLALSSLGAEAAETTMIGNRISRDVLGANLLGMTSIYYKWNDRYDYVITSKMEEPDYTIKSLKEVPGIVEGVNLSPRLKQAPLVCNQLT